jgi:outer membrane lipoprotein SlyB
MWAGLARAQLTGPPPPPIPPESPPSAAAQAGNNQPPPACDRCGTVGSIRQSTSKEQWTSLGNVPSRVGQSGSDISPSAVTTFKIGPGFTNQGQVMIGAAGGAVYQTSPTTERNATRWEITVRMDDGTSRSVTQNYEPLLQVGDRVRVFGSQIELIQKQ